MSGTGDAVKVESQEDRDMRLYWEMVTPPRHRLDWFKEVGAPIKLKAQMIGGVTDTWTEAPRWAIWIAGILEYNEAMAANFYQRVRDDDELLSAFVTLTNLLGSRYDILEAAVNFAMTGDWNEKYVEDPVELVRDLRES